MFLSPSGSSWAGSTASMTPSSQCFSFVYSCPSSSRVRQATQLHLCLLQVSLGTVKQCEMALSRITASLSFFIHEYKQLASYRAQVDRLYDFRACGLAFMKAQS